MSPSKLHFRTNRKWPANKQEWPAKTILGNGQPLLKKIDFSQVQKLRMGFIVVLNVRDLRPLGLGRLVTLFFEISQSQPIFKNFRKTIITFRNFEKQGNESSQTQWAQVPNMKNNYGTHPQLLNLKNRFFNECNLAGQKCTWTKM